MFSRRAFLISLSIVVLAVFCACTTQYMPDARPDCFCRPGLALKQFEIKEGRYEATYTPCVNECDKCLEKKMQISKHKSLNLLIELTDGDLKALRKGDHVFECIEMSERIDIAVEIYYMGPLTYPDPEEAEG